MIGSADHTFGADRCTNQLTWESYSGEAVGDD